MASAALQGDAANAAVRHFDRAEKMDRDAVCRLLAFKQNEVLQFGSTAADAQSEILDQAVGILNLLRNAYDDADVRQREIGRGANVEESCLAELYPIQLSRGLAGVSTLISLAKFMENGR